MNLIYISLSKYSQPLFSHNKMILSHLLGRPKPLRLQLDLYLLVNLMMRFFLQPKPIDVQVITHHMQRYAVWFGGSMLASTVRIFLRLLFEDISYFSILKSSYVLVLQYFKTTYNRDSGYLWIFNGRYGKAVFLLKYFSVLK